MNTCIYIRKMSKAVYWSDVKECMEKNAGICLIMIRYAKKITGNGRKRCLRNGIFNGTNPGKNDGSSGVS